MKVFSLLLFGLSSATIVSKSFNQTKIETSERVSDNLHKLDLLLRKLDQRLNDKKLKIESERQLVSQLKSESVKARKLSDVKPTVINIPVPRIKETELEVVHVFPQGYPGGYGGYNQGGYGGAFSPNLIPSYSVSTNLNGSEQVNNFWGFNPSS